MRVAITVVLAALLSGFAARPGAPEDDRAATAGWDREGAARYLDERMEVWFANAKKLRTGEGGEYRNAPGAETPRGSHTSRGELRRRPTPLRLQREQEDGVARDRGGA